MAAREEGQQGTPGTQNTFSDGLYKDAIDLYKKKVCWTCKKEKPIELYSNYKKKKDGKNHNCRECCSLYNKNKEKPLSDWAKYKKINKELPTGYRMCKKCSLVKEENEFEKISTKLYKEGISSKCLNCSKEQLQQWHKKNYIPSNRKTVKDCVLNDKLKCRKCTLLKDISNYPKTPYGFSAVCSTCRNERDRKKRNNNLVEAKQKEKQYRDKYRKSDKGIASSKRIYKKQKETNSHIHRMRTILWRFLRQINRNKTLKTTELLGYSCEDFKNKFPFIPDDHHLDHIIPLSWFSENVPANIANSLSNLQITTKDYNLSKGCRFCNNVSKEFYNVVLHWILPDYKNKITYNG